MQYGTDGKGQRFIEWDVGAGGLKRAWVQHRQGIKDWAGTGRYLNVVRIDSFNSGPSGNATDFPIYNNLPDDQILRNFVFSTAAVVGLNIP